METKDITQTPQFKAFKAAIDKMVDDFWKHEAERISDIIKEAERISDIIKEERNG